MSEKMRGVVIEFDFTVVDGAKLLFDTAAGFLANLDGLPFDARNEAMYFAGRDYETAFQAYLDFRKSKKTAVKSAKDFACAFEAALTAAAPTAVTPEFLKVIESLKGHGLKIVISTRADFIRMREALGDALDECCALYREVTPGYGFPRWDAWRRACCECRLDHLRSLAITGSGFGVKSALRAGLGAVAVLNPHVAYQDFSGADAFVEGFGPDVATTALNILHLEK